MKKLLPLLLFSAACILSGAAQKEKSSFYHFDLSKTGLIKQKSGAWLWKLPADQKMQKIVFDLDKLNVMPNDYDEVRVLLKNVKANSDVMVRITDYPAKDQLRSWYSKTAIPMGKVVDLRFDMRLDDDGWCHGAKKRDGRKLEVSLLKVYRRTPGEPPDRESEIHAIQFIRRSADLKFDETAATFRETWLNYVWRYDFVVLNRESVPRKMKLVIDTRGLKHFKADWTSRTLELGPREQVVIPFEIYISKAAAAKLPSLYSERVLPKLIFDDDCPAVFPLIGYRPRYVWGTVPIRENKYQLAVPEKESARKKLIAQADKYVKSPFTVPPQVAPAYCAIFKPREMEALSFYRIRDRKTGKDISDKPKLAASYVYHHNREVFVAIKCLGQAYKMTGNKVYAEKIRDILLEYAYWFRFLPPQAPSSTSGGSRLTYTTLDLCYFFLDGVEGYVEVRDSGVFGKADRDAIENTIFLPLMKELYTHNIQYSNMQLHHISSYGSAALIMNRCQNLLGDALYGDHGFYKFQENGFTADGMALEGGVYHWFGVAPLLNFTQKMRGVGVELIGEKFKQIYDFGINNTPHGVAENLRGSYVHAWKLFRDERYLPTLKFIKKLPAGIEPATVPDRLDMKSTLQKNNGYAWLRENSKYGFRAAAINWIMGWDRLEHDRLSYRLFDDKGMISHEVHRVGYTNPGAKMSATISHNTIVMDEKDAAANQSTLASFLDRKSMPALLITENPQSRLYPDLDSSRVMAIFDGIIFVGDKVHARDGKVHTFDWPFYNPWQPWAAPGKFEFNVPGNFNKQLKTGYKYVASSPCADAAKDLKVNVAIPWSPKNQPFDVRRKSDRKLYLNFALPQKTTVAKFMIGRGHKPQPGPMLLLRQKGKGAEFACAFDVVKTGGKVRVKSVKSLPFTPADPLSAVWEVKADSGTYYVVVNRTGKDLKFNNMTVKAMLDVIKK